VQQLSLANPFYHLAEAYRSILTEHQVPSIEGMVFVAVLSIVVFHFGLAAFRRAKGYFDSAL
jgi:ABC-type polysaccharide/polyol phosphate export permease